MLHCGVYIRPSTVISKACPHASCTAFRCIFLSGFPLCLLYCVQRCSSPRGHTSSYHDHTLPIARFTMSHRVQHPQQPSVSFLGDVNRSFALPQLLDEFLKSYPNMESLLDPTGFFRGVLKALSTTYTRRSLTTLELKQMLSGVTIRTTAAKDLWPENESCTQSVLEKLNAQIDETTLGQANNTNPLTERKVCLQRRIVNLEDEVKRKQRVATAIDFRYVIETLVEARPGECRENRRCSSSRRGSAPESRNVRAIPSPHSFKCVVRTLSNKEAKCFGVCCVILFIVILMSGL